MNAIKKTNLKRILSMLLVLMMVLTMLPLTAWALCYGGTKGAKKVDYSRAKRVKC